MAFRDEGDAILERVRALTRELKDAKHEIHSLRRQITGEPDPGPVLDPKAASIIDELSSARALLAGLISDDEGEADDGVTAKESAESKVVPTPAPRIPHGVGLLRRVLKTILVRKLGAINAKVRQAIDDTSDVEELIERIVAVALAPDEPSTLAALGSPSS